MPRLSAVGLVLGWLVCLDAIVLVAAGACSAWARGLFCAKTALVEDGLAHGGRRGPRSPARVAGGRFWWVGGAA